MRPSTAKIKLFTICATSTPIAAAASAAVLVPSGKRRGSIDSPSVCAASITRRTFGCSPAFTSAGYPSRPLRSSTARGRRGSDPGDLQRRVDEVVVGDDRTAIGEDRDRRVGPDRGG